MPQSGWKYKLMMQCKADDERLSDLFTLESKHVQSLSSRSVHKYLDLKRQAFTLFRQFAHNVTIRGKVEYLSYVLRHVRAANTLDRAGSVRLLEGSVGITVLVV